MLKQLFDDNILEEESILSWHSDYARNEYSADASLITIDDLELLKASAQPVVTWLLEAEEEGEEEEEEEEGDDDDVAPESTDA